MKRIAFLTDLHLDEQVPRDHKVDTRKNFERVLSDLAARKITELVIGGDIGEASAHAYFFEAVKPYTTQLILGNHDHYKKVSEYFSKGTSLEELYYASEEDRHKFLYLDTSSGRISNTQMEWLQAELQTKHDVVVFLHHPLLPVPSAMDKLYPLQNRDALKTFLVNHTKGATLFCGHYHTDDEGSYRNIRQFTTPALSFQLKKNTDHLQFDPTHFGYRIIEIYPDEIKTEVITFPAVP